MGRQKTPLVTRQSGPTGSQYGFRRVPDFIQVADIRPVFTGAGVNEVTQPYAYARHQHTRYEIIYVDEGLYCCQHNELELKLGKDSLLILKPGDWHRDHFDGRYVRYFGIAFYLEASGGITPTLFRDGTAPQRQHFKANRKDFVPIIRKVMEESQRGDFISSHIQDALVLEFFYRMVRAVPRRVLSEYFVESSREAAFASRLVSVLNRRISRPLSVGRMSGIMGMSESALAHRCKDILGCSPARLFFRLKMDRAMKMLRSTDMSVKEVSAYLGFSSQFHFSAAFKKTFGYPPSGEGRQTANEPG
ncbi:MAG: AraC family transcriptional regulator [Kiritimatiellae bacterium]|nr:AraC family transcriptional regulator [Kiritimatiellia bacterium]